MNGVLMACRTGKQKGPAVHPRTAPPAVEPGRPPGRRNPGLDRPDLRMSYVLRRVLSSHCNLLDQVAVVRPGGWFQATCWAALLSALYELEFSCFLGHAS